MDEGVVVRLGSAVVASAVERQSGSDGGVSIAVVEDGQRGKAKETVSCGHFVNASGLYADVIAKKMDFGLQYAILPFKACYNSDSDKEGVKKKGKKKMNRDDGRFPSILGCYDSVDVRCFYFCVCRRVLVSCSLYRGSVGSVTDTHDTIHWLFLTPFFPTNRGYTFTPTRLLS